MASMNTKAFPAQQERRQCGGERRGELDIGQSFSLKGVWHFGDAGLRSVNPFGWM